MITDSRVRESMRNQKICVVIPTYNNVTTVGGVVDSVLQYCSDVIVVVDGATDGTAEVVSFFGDRVTSIVYSPNRGKGYALKLGFARALERGFDYAVTIDSDGQHYAADLPAFVECNAAHSGALIVGSRTFGVANMPARNSFANRFSNFWFTVQTLHRLPDTQTGYRLYPLRSVCAIHLFTARYEAELEMLVRAVWRGVEVVPIPVGVNYKPAGERVSHFRRGRDFLRISLLNSVLTICTLFWGYPSMLFHRLTRKKRGGQL